MTLTACVRCATPAIADGRSASEPGGASPELSQAADLLLSRARRVRLASRHGRQANRLALSLKTPQVPLLFPHMPGSLGIRRGGSPPPPSLFNSPRPF
jgi:hypothetical protein